MVISSALSSRELTRNEVEVLRHLLGRRFETEEDQIRSSGLPRSTYLDVKQRLYAHNVVEDRYVPAPGFLGIPRVSFVLLHPHARSRDSIVQFLTSVQGSVLVWSGVHSAFAVVFHRTPKEARAFDASLAGVVRLGPQDICLEVVPEEPTIPVYFDYEGAWNHFCGLQTTVRYPRGLPFSPRSRGGNSGPTGKTLEEVRALMSQPVDFGPARKRLHLVGPATLARPQRKLLLSGVIEWRTFLDVKNLPIRHGEIISDVIFVSGTLRTPESLFGVFRDLTGQSGIYPFLLVAGANRALIGVLARQGNSRSAGRSASPVRPSTGAYTIITRHLDEVEVTREPLASLEVALSHRYDRALPPTHGGC